LITAIQGITSGVAALVIIICFVMRMVSKNQRSVDEASTWLKRAAISLVCVNMIGFIITFIIGIAGNDTVIPT
jgi:preprotein translocase subunit Sss1